MNPAHLEEDFRHIPQTAAERLAKALPFPGVSDISEFSRNYLNYGLVYFQQGYLDQAEVSFRLALRDDPSSAEAFYGLGSAYLKQEKINEARESFERATKLQASYPDTLANAWNNLGLVATREGRSGDFVFSGSAQTQPRSSDCAREPGKRHRQQKRWNEARELLERAVKSAPRTLRRTTV